MSYHHSLELVTINHLSWKTSFILKILFFLRHLMVITSYMEFENLQETIHLPRVATIHLCVALRWGTTYSTCNIMYPLTVRQMCHSSARIFSAATKISWLCLSEQFIGKNVSSQSLPGPWFLKRCVFFLYNSHILIWVFFNLIKYISLYWMLARSTVKRKLCGYSGLRPNNYALPFHCHLMDVTVQF